MWRTGFNFVSSRGAKAVLPRGEAQLIGSARGRGICNAPPRSHSNSSFFLIVLWARRGARAPRRRGDWTCDKCSTNNFARLPAAIGRPGLAPPARAPPFFFARKRIFSGPPFAAVTAHHTRTPAHKTLCLCRIVGHIMSTPHAGFDLAAAGARSLSAAQDPRALGSGPSGAPTACLARHARAFLFGGGWGR